MRKRLHGRIVQNYSAFGKRKVAHEMNARVLGCDGRPLLNGAEWVSPP
jgi:hypothetical protein